MRCLLLFVYSILLSIGVCIACCAQVFTPPTKIGRWPPIQSPKGVDAIRWQVRDIPFLIRELRQDAAITRTRAARALRSLGPAAHDAIPALQTLTQDMDVHVRLEAACALLTIDSSEQPAALRVILTALKDPDSTTRKQSAFRLYSLGKRARDAGPALVNALRDEDEEVRETVSQALTTISATRSDVIPPLLVLIDYSNAQVKKNAIYHLGRFGRYTDEQVRKKVIGQLTARDEKIRLTAAMALFQLHSEDFLIEQSILKGLKSSNRENRMECAAFVLKHIDGHQDEVFASFTLGLKEVKEEDFAMSMTIRRICDLAQTNDHALAFFVGLIRQKDRDVQIRDYALGAVNTLGPRAKCAIPTLIHCLAEEYPIGGHAARALGAMRDTAKDSIPFLERSVRRHQRDFLIDLNSYDAALALTKIDPENAVSTQYLLGLMKRPSNSEARIMGVSGFLDMDLLPHAAIPELIRKATTDTHPTVRRLSIKALGQVSGGDRTDAVRALITALRDPEPLVRETAAVSLGRFGADSFPASAPLARLFRDDNLETRLAAVIAHRMIGDRSPRSVEALVELLGDRRASIREQAAISLATLENAACESIPMISRLLSDDEPRVSLAARYALSRIPKK